MMRDGATGALDTGRMGVMHWSTKPEPFSKSALAQRLKDKILHHENYTRYATTRMVLASSASPTHLHLILKLTRLCTGRTATENKKHVLRNVGNIEC